jgi:DUF4097 and DUF4098 domain-containing protein YvlB
MRHRRDKIVRPLLIAAALAGSAALVGLVLAPSAAMAAPRSVNKELTAKADGSVEVHNVAGSVEVTAWSKNKVQVKGTLGDGVDRLEFKGSGGRTKIRVVGPSHGRMESSDLQIKVPAGSRVDVTTVSARIDVKGVSGGLELESVSGDVTAEGKPGEIEVTTVSGKIKSVAGKQRTVARSVSGPIEVRGGTGDLRLKSVSGKVRALGGPFGRSEMGSVSGDIYLDGALGRSGPFKLTSHSGDAELKLPKNVKAVFDLVTFSGQISSNLGGTVKEGQGPGRSLHVERGSGGPDVQIRTFSGDISVKVK